MLLGELVAHVVQQQLIEVVAAQVRVAVTGEDLDHALFHLHDGNVEGAAAQVIDQQPLHVLRVRVVGQGGGGRLVDDADDLQAGQLARLARRLALHFVEEGGHGNDGLADRVAEELLRALLQAAENDGRDLLRGILPVAQPDPHVLSHLPLDGADSPLGGKDPLISGRRADQQPALRVQAHNRRQNGLAVGADHLGPAVANHGHLAVGRTQIDAYDRFHQNHSSVVYE